VTGSISAWLRRDPPTFDSNLLLHHRSWRSGSCIVISERAITFSTVHRMGRDQSIAIKNCGSVGHLAQGPCCTDFSLGMASDVRSLQNAASEPKSKADSAKTHPGHIQTNNLTRNPRYSYLETPVEMQGATFQQFSSPTNSTIDESPISPQRAYTDSLYGATPVTLSPPEKPPVMRTPSPYGLPPPPEVHPAYFAPEAVSTHSMHQSAPAAAEPLPVKSCEGHETGARVDQQEFTDGHGTENPPRKLASQIRVPTVYNPDSLAGPNGALDNHRPGQVSHPNAAVDPEWKHGMCTPDALCCLGIFCPCNVYGKTQYRLSKKAKKQDPTDLLGYESCNGSCGVFAVACGFQCKHSFETSQRLTEPIPRDPCYHTEAASEEILSFERCSRLRLLEVALLLLLCSRPERKRSSRSRRLHPQKCRACKCCLRCAGDNDLCTAAEMIHDHYGGRRDLLRDARNSRGTCALAANTFASSRLEQVSLHIRQSSQK